MFDWVNRIEFVEKSPLLSQASEHKFGFQRHKPEIMASSHWHGHIEINYLFRCSADYLFNGQKITVPEGRMIAFWATMPHQMTNYYGDGEMINIYIPLHAFLTWKLPSDYVSSLLHGNVLVSDKLYSCDAMTTDMWQNDLDANNMELTIQVISEIKNRIRRMAIEPYQAVNFSNEEVQGNTKSMLSGIHHIQNMLNYIADNYDQKITISDVTQVTGLHQNYAMRLFNRIMKVPIKQYINQLRLQHAQALLVDTDSAVMNVALEAGFGSISRFYENFQKEFEMSPQEFRKKVNTT